MEHRFERRLEKFVGVDKPPTLTINAFDTAEFTATRVRWNQADHGHPVQFERSDGFMVCLQRTDVPAQPYWVDQRPVGLGAMRSGQFLLLDLNVEHSSLVPTGVDCISIYSSRDALIRFQEEHGLVANGELRTPIGATHDDAIVRHLGECLLPAIEDARVASRLFADHVAVALLSRLADQFGVWRLQLDRLRGGLAPWQERRAKDLLLAHLDGSIGLEMLANECRLSRSHFARAFKVSTGSSPLRWLTLQRVQCAKIMLLNSNETLDQIAASCGFTDASHLTRAFIRHVGIPPGCWRNARRF